MEHTGDNKTGEGEGDAEVLIVRLNKIPDSIAKLLFTVTIHEHDERGQNFGMVESAYIRIVNDENGKEIARFDLTEKASTSTAMIFGEINRQGGWEFKPIEHGFNCGLESLAQSYGVKVG